LTKQAEPHLTGPEQGAWLVRLEIEHDNLRAALAAPDDAGDRTLRLAAALWRFWDMRGHFSEGRRWLEQALAGSAANHPATVARADALNGSGVLAYLQGDYARAVTRYQESLAIRRQRGDKAGVAASLNNLGLVAEDQGDHAGAVALYEESLAVRRELGDQLNIAASLNNLGVVAEDQGDYARATKLHEEALAIMRKLGNQRGVAVSLSNLGRVAHEQGDDARSVVLLEECLEILRELGDRNGYIVGLEDVAGLAASVTNAAPVVRLLSAAAVLREELGVPTTPVEHARNERALTAARASLSEPALIELQASGRALGAERAIAEAITVLREVATTLRIPNQAG
jgi:tetratricopeptide (TPR) repeat protein